MRDIRDELGQAWREGRPVGLATVVGTWRSAPRPAGASMVVDEEGTAAGSVSGGCVEGAVYELCRQALDTGEPRLQRYGITDDDAFEVGLTCGGIIDLWVEKVSPETFPQLGAVLESIDGGEPVAVVTCIEGPADRSGKRLIVWNDRRAGGLGSDRLDDAVADDIRGMLATGQTGIVHYGHDGERRGDELSFFVASHAPRPRMLVFGAIDFAAAVARVGHFLGYQVTVCDARPVFATRKRFPDADEVVVDWPHRYLAKELGDGRLDPRTVVCVLTHDPKFDVPVLEVALRQDFAYVGAMGSRRTHDDRNKRLLDAGMTHEELARLASPIGLDLGARTPEETAVSIAAEIIATRWGGRGARLKSTDGRIHHDDLPAEPPSAR